MENLKIYNKKLRNKKQKMIITARFTGVNNSLGYKNGEEYKLKVANKKGMSIQAITGTGKCVYESLSAFLKNWNNIKVEETP